MHTTMPPSPKQDSEQRVGGQKRLSVSAELRAYLCHRMMREGHWSYDMPDGRTMRSLSPAMAVTLRDIYARMQVNTTPVVGGYRVAAVWHGLYPFQGAHHMASGTYEEVIPDGLDLTKALAKEALRACTL